MNRNTISLNDLLNLKKSRKVYIIGSASSLNNLSSTDWECISRSDSIGLNFSFLHEHVPTIQLAQLPFRLNDLNDKMKMIHGLNKKLEENPDIVVILRSIREYFKSGSIDKYEKIKNFSIPKSETIIPFLNKNSFTINLLIVKRFINPLLIHSRGGALTSAIYLASQMGYKKIELVGINDGSPNYFYHDDKFISSSLYRDFIPISKQSLSLHGHFASSGVKDQLDTQEVIDIIKFKMLNPHGIEIIYYNSNRLN